MQAPPTVDSTPQLSPGTSAGLSKHNSKELHVVAPSASVKMVQLSTLVSRNNKPLEGEGRIALGPEDAVQRPKSSWAWCCMAA